MSALKINLEELKAALGELEARGKGDIITIDITDRQLKMSCEDRNSDIMEAVLYDGSSLGAQFRMTHRLMYMKDKKRI